MNSGKRVSPEYPDWASRTAQAAGASQKER